MHLFKHVSYHICILTQGTPSHLDTPSHSLIILSSLSHSLIILTCFSHYVFTSSCILIILPFSSHHPRIVPQDGKPVLRTTNTTAITSALAFGPMAKAVRERVSKHQHQGGGEGGAGGVQSVVGNLYVLTLTLLITTLVYLTYSRSLLFPMFIITTTSVYLISNLI